MVEDLKKVVFLGEECHIVRRQYPNGRLALQLVCSTHGDPMGTATVNIPNYPLGEKEVIIKDYSEIEGMLKALVDAGVVEDTGKVAPSGYIVGNVCKLLI